nr:50S ribosome-binding GTPase [Succinivibrionaceae bacterium]
MSVKTIALIGNQNAGKTTLFNAYTGANQSVGNWPGVTVDKTVGKIAPDTVRRLREAFRNQSGDIRIAQTGLPDCCKPEAKVDPRVLAAQSPEDSFFVVD